MSARTPEETRGGHANVLFLDHTAEMGGAEVAMVNLLAALDRRRVSPRVILFADGPLVRRVGDLDVPVEVLPLDAAVGGAKKGRLGEKTAWSPGKIRAAADFVARLSRQMRNPAVESRRADRRSDRPPLIVHCNSLKADLLGGLAARAVGLRDRKVRVVWHLHDRVEPDYLPANIVTAFRAAARRVPHGVIANSHASLATLRLGDRKPTAVAYPALPPTAFAPRPDGRPRPIRRIGIVGRLAPWKGQHVFLRAAGEVLRTHPHTRFDVLGGPLFGEDAYARRLQDLLDALGLSHAVTLNGHVDDVPDRLRELDLLVHASTTPEPFGQVITEAMAAGKAVIATDGGGVREIVTHERTGLLIPLGDEPTMASALASAVRRLINDPPLAGRLARAGYDHVTQAFTIERSARVVQDFYDVLGSGPLPDQAAAST